VNQDELQAHVGEVAEALEVPGVAVGVYHAGEEHYAFHGVTSIENPLPVDANTLFQFGSTGKTYTATAIMRLVERGDLDLNERVRTYLPELRLKDESVAEQVTLLHLLNHTAGWEGDLLDNTGDGDDAIAKYVELMADIEQVTPLGSTVSYNNASLSVAGHVIAKVTGKTYEQAMKELIFEPLGLSMTFFFPNDIMTRRFVVGHNQHPDESITVARPWALARAGWPAGGMSATARDQIAWARFHLGDGTADDGTRVLSEELLRKMQQPTVEMPGSALGDAVGISWMLRDVDGVRVVAHGGDTIGQHSMFEMIPERDFAVISMTNCGPNGGQFNEDVVKWAFEHYLGVVEQDPEPVELSEEELAPYTGHFETIAATCDITVDAGRLLLQADLKPETRAKLEEAGEDIDTPEPFPLGILPGGDRYIITDGPAKGMKGYFARDAAGNVEAVHVGGRLATKTAVPAGAR
jgi:CubicO group peptidase (beta-lactamase class C family)